MADGPRSPPKRGASGLRLLPEERRRGQNGTRRRRGRPFKDDRLTLNTMLYVLRTGVPWRDLPDFYGPWASVYTRDRRWVAGGLFARIVAALADHAEGQLRHVDCCHPRLTL
jgi:transposase